MRSGSRSVWARSARLGVASSTSITVTNQVWANSGSLINSASTGFIVRSTRPESATRTFFSSPTTRQGKVEEWKTAELVSWLEKNTEPKIPKDWLDGFATADVEGATLAGISPSVLFDRIKKAVETNSKISLDEKLYQETILGSSSYSVKRTPRPKPKQIFT